jgi:hypothetical protein
MKRFRVAFLLLMSAALALVPKSAFAQQGGYAIFAPFISSLHADVNGDTVKLVWKDSSSVRGPVYVYRSLAPFANGVQFNKNEVVEVPYGRQAYSELASSKGDWYYYVVASDEKEQKYEIIIPLSNIIQIKVDGQNHSFDAASSNIPTSAVTRSYNDRPMQPMPAQSPVENSAFNALWPDYPPNRNFQSTETINVGGITANADNNHVRITFSSEYQGKNAVLYRSIVPIRRFSDLLTATVVQVGVNSPYLDNVTAGVPYYYAIVYEEDIKAGVAEIMPGLNATVIPAEVSSGRRNAASTSGTSVSSGFVGKPGFSYQPVPNTAIDEVQKLTVPGSGRGSEKSSFSTINSPPQITQELNRREPEVIGNVKNPLAPVLLREPRVINQDLQNNSTTGDDGILSSIVKGPFMWRDWNTSRDKLLGFLSEPRSSTSIARARFYLGQCYYFIGNYRGSLTEFLSVQSRWPDEIAVWVQACLSKIADQ